MKSIINSVLVLTTMAFGHSSFTQMTISKDSILKVPAISEIQFETQITCRCICQLSEKLILTDIENFAEISTRPEVKIIETKSVPIFSDHLVYPNPAKEETTLSFQVKEEERFEITLFDLNGREVQVIYSGQLKKGRQSIRVDLSNLESGLYSVVLTSKNTVETMKIQKLN